MLRALIALGLLAPLIQAEPSADDASTSSVEEPNPWDEEFSNLPQEQRDQFGGHLAKARELFNQKRIFECIEELSKAEAIFSDSPDVENMLGACQVEFRNFDQAMEHFKRADELQPDAPSLLFNIAEVYFVQHDWETAARRFEELLEKSNEDNLNLMMRRLVEFKLMLCKVKLGQVDEAREMATRYDHLDDSPYPYYAEAAMAFHDGNELIAETAIARAGRIFRNPSIVSPWQDTLMEFGYLKSFFGGTLTEPEE